MFKFKNSFACKKIPLTAIGVELEFSRELWLLTILSSFTGGARYVNEFNVSLNHLFLLK